MPFESLSSLDAVDAFDLPWALERPKDRHGFVRYQEGCFPEPPDREHRHTDFELRLILSTSGTALVGDHIGSFEPGHLVLVGPGLFHRWWTVDAPAKGVERRDIVLRFPAVPLWRAAEALPELREALPLLERSSCGVVFHGMAERARERLLRIKAAEGLHRFAAFSGLLSDLSRCTDYRLLSGAVPRAAEGEVEVHLIDEILGRILTDPARPPSALVLAGELGMTEGRFGRRFRAATGRTYTDFIVRVRVEQACRLLQREGPSVGQVAREAGFRTLSIFNRHFARLKGITPSDYRRQFHINRIVN